jgi:Tfp pilus assembly protein FimT
MSLLGIIGGFTAFMSVDGYRSFSFRSDRDTLVSLLERARSQSVSNICRGALCDGGAPHGVHVVSGGYTVFQGESYALRDTVLDETTPSSYTTTISGTLVDVVFRQLSGDIAVPGDIIISDDSGHTSTISINTEGRISWTN